MPKRRRGSDSDATTTRTMGYNTVFVDTNLDTSLATVVFDSDTVSDFKKNLAWEHKQCYPEMEIRIHSLKVKQRSRFYRLSDSMLVWSAFHGVKRRWYLSVDASCSPSNTNSSELGLVVSMKTMDVGNVDNNCGVLSSDINRIQTLPMPLPGCASENNEVLDMIPYIEFGNSLDNKTDDIQKETGSPAKKKRKTRHTRDECHDPGSKESDPLSHTSSKDTVIPDTLVCGISTVDAVKEGIGAEVSVVRNDASVLEGKVASQGIGKKGNLESTVDCQNPTGSDERKNDTVLESTTIPENMTVSQDEYEPGLDIQADHSGVVYVKVPDISAGSTLTKRKRKKAQETAVNIQYATDLEKTPTGKSIKPCPEEKEEENHLSLSRDREVEMPSSYKAGLTHKEASSKIMPGSKESDPLSHTSSKDTVIPDTLVCGISTVGAVKEGIGAEVSVVRNDGSVLEGRVASQGIGKKGNLGSTADCQNPTGSDERKNDTVLESTTIPENLTASQNEYEPGLDIQADHSGVVYVKVPDISTGSTLTKRKRKRKKAQETAVNIQYATDLEKTPTGKSIKPCPEEKEEEKHLSLSRDREVEMPSSYKAGLTHKEASSKIMVPSKKKKKKIEKMSSNTKLEKSGTEKTDHDFSGGPPGLVRHHIPIQNDKEESTMDCKKSIVSDERKNDIFLESIIIPENLSASKELEPGLDIRADNSGADFVKAPDISSGLMDDNGTIENINSTFIKKKRKKTQEKAVNIQDATEVEQTPKGDIHKFEGKEEEKHLSLNSDHEVDIQSSNKASDHTNPGLKHKKESNIMIPSKKKKIKKKSANTNLEKTGLLCLSTPHLPLETGKEENILFPGGEDVQLKLMNDSTLDVVHVGDGNEADFVMSSQTKQTLEVVSSGKRETNKETQNSPGNGHADIPVVEKENQIVEFHKLEKDTENTANTGKSAKKKRKNKTLTTSDVQEYLSVKNRNVGIGSSTEENSIKYANSGVDGIHLDSSQVISCKSKENLEQKHEIAVYTNDQARTNESEGEGVNFKQYFVPDHYQDKSGSHGKAKKPNQSDGKILKKLKKNGQSSVSISTELQSSSKLSADGDRKNKSCVRKDSGKREGDSAQNSDWDEVIPNSSRRSSRAPEKNVKDSVTSEIPGTLFKKPEEILAVSSLPKKKNASLKKSSSERIEKFPEKCGNKMPHFGVNVTNRMELKTPEKKSLLTKLGSLFEDNSGESSGDENGTAHSSDSTQSPSDSSFTSYHTVGESDLSLDSARNGSSDARVRSTGGKGTPKLDLSAMKGVTMKMILQSSNRFKKAKLLASQNEAYQIDSQPIDFVPDIQPS